MDVAVGFRVDRKPVAFIGVLIEPSMTGVVDQQIIGVRQRFAELPEGGQDLCTGRIDQRRDAKSYWLRRSALTDRASPAAVTNFGRWR